MSSLAIGLDGLLSYYNWQNNEEETKLLKICHDKFSALSIANAMYAASADNALIELFEKNKMGFSGITLTCPGFYGAQNRQLRAPLANTDLFAIARDIEFNNQVITNLEMETAAIYGMCRLLGHDACSISALVANRYTQTFSANPDKTVDQLIQKALMVLCERNTVLVA